MWLMHTQFLKLQNFSNPPPKYAILSHVWDSTETSFQDVQAPGTRRLRSKIVEACKYAAADGFEWLWADTCCIDKTNSTELSEAINSMFRWYAEATICYAYLFDVPNHENYTEHISAFKNSKWHTRGWTLQELLAPRDVHFLSTSWECIGTKSLLAPVLEEITGVNTDVLQRHDGFSSVSVAERLAWASGRVTTRLEDEAYCLMGIFNVNIPVIYGEGGRAFQRLQEEIIRTTPDHTLFTWGLSTTPPYTICACSPELRRRHAPRNLFPGLREANLLASSPVSFAAISQQQQTAISTRPMAVPYSNFTSRLRALLKSSGQDDSTISRNTMHKLPDFSLTSFGIRAYLPVVPFPPSLIDTACLESGASGSGSKRRLRFSTATASRMASRIESLTHETDDIFLALLVCFPGPTREQHSLVGLILRRPPGSHMFYVGARQSHTSGPSGVRYYTRYLEVTTELLNLIPAKDKLDIWQTVYISQTYIPDAARSPHPEDPAALVKDRRVRFVVPTFVRANLKKCGFLWVPCETNTNTTGVVKQHDSMTYIFRRRTDGPTPASSSPQTSADAGCDGFQVHFGFCGRTAWIEVQPLGPLGSCSKPHLDARWHHRSASDCSQTHVTDWETCPHPSEASRLDHGMYADLQWDRHHTFELSNTDPPMTVHIRVAGEFLSRIPPYSQVFGWHYDTEVLTLLTVGIDVVDGSRADTLVHTSSIQASSPPTVGTMPDSHPDGCPSIAR